MSIRKLHLIKVLYSSMLVMGYPIQAAVTHITPQVHRAALLLSAFAGSSSSSRASAMAEASLGADVPGLVVAQK